MIIINISDKIFTQTSYLIQKLLNALKDAWDNTKKREGREHLKILRTVKAFLPFHNIWLIVFFRKKSKK